MFYEPEVIDYSIPYKTFNELCDGDTVFLVDYKKLEVIEYSISDLKKKNITDDYYKKNCTVVNFSILLNPRNEQFGIVHISNGNTYIKEVTITYGYASEYCYVTTDKRLADIMLSILNNRNIYQWDSFSKIFGDPLSGRYESKHIRLH